MMGLENVTEYIVKTLELPLTTDEFE